jgi:hypothetical protein
LAAVEPCDHHINSLESLFLVPNPQVFFLYVSNPPSLSSDSSIAKLDIECNELIRTWKSFQAFVPSGDRVASHGHPQGAEDVQQIIQTAKGVWTSSKPNGGLRDLIALAERVAATMASHSMMMSALPHDTVYSALFFGTMHSAIKVRFIPLLLLSIS